MARAPRTPKARRRSSELSVLKRQRTARLTKLAAKAALLQRRGKNDEAYTLICDEFVSLGGIYVKFLQGVLLNSPLMKRWHSNNKLRIFENLDAQPIDIIQLLHHELGPEKVQQIARLQTEPFAAGSFGQVYYGELRNGQPIIVKALRPQVRALLLHDLRLLGLFTRFFVGRQYRSFDLKLDDVIKDFRRATLTETDYVQEAEFADEMYRAQAHNPDVVIPRTYLDLSTSQIIVQDYVNGLSCADVLQQQADRKIEPATYVKQQLGSDLAVQLELLGITMLSDCFVHPRVMGDPHPGNIRLLPENKVALIDFGISAHAPHNRAAFYGLIREWSRMYNGAPNIAGLFEQFLRVFVSDLYRALKKLTRYYPQDANADNQQVQSMMKRVGGLITEMLDMEVDLDDLKETMAQGKMLRLFNQFINKGNRLGLVIKFEDIDLLRAAQTYMQTVEALGLRAEVLSRVFADVAESQAAAGQEISDVGEKQITTSQAFEIVNSWLERVASKDPMLFRKLLMQVTGGPGERPRAVRVRTINPDKPPQEEQHA